MNDGAQPSRTRGTRAEARSDRREIPGDVLRAQSLAAHLPVKTMRARPRRPVHTLRVRALFL